MDSQGLFIDVSIGWPGKVHHAHVLASSSFCNKYNRGMCFLDWTKCINDVDIPLLILGDPTYLLPWLMKPYPDTGNLTRQQQHYNYRQSRARMVVENAFGRIKGWWRYLLKRMIKTHGSESRGQEAQSACPQNNKHATTTVSHLHEGSITQSFKIRMAKSQPY